MKIARIYLRVSTDEQDLTRQAEIEHSSRSAGYYIAGVYREKASGARTDRPELLRMIADLDIIRHISPQIWEHINLTGIYDWRGEAHPKGTFRPLRITKGKFGRGSKRAVHGLHRKWPEPRQPRDSTFRV